MRIVPKISHLSNNACVKSVLFNMDNSGAYVAFDILESLKHFRDSKKCLDGLNKLRAALKSEDGHRILGQLAEATPNLEELLIIWDHQVKASDFIMNSILGFLNKEKTNYQFFKAHRPPHYFTPTHCCLLNSCRLRTMALLLISCSLFLMYLLLW